MYRNDQVIFYYNKFGNLHTPTTFKSFHIKWHSDLLNDLKPIIT